MKNTTTFYLYETKTSNKLLAKGIYEGYETNSPSNNTMVVLEGSHMKKRNTLSKSHCISKRRKVESESVIDKEDYYLITEDISFSSPSIAAAVILGRECNGKELWVTEDRVELKHIIPSARKVSKKV